VKCKAPLRRKAEWLAGAELCTITNSKKAGYVTSKHANGEHVHLGIARYICLFLGAKVELMNKNVLKNS